MQNVDRKARSFLEKWLHKTVKEYVAHMDGGQNGHLHDTIVGGIEKPLVEIVLKEVKGNKTQAANILGINRNTLRKKIQDHNIQWD
ncbi:MAG: Fis family transcriptional regulator [Candidatus Nitrohelix vancouverensis]|uniref:Putative Fis-like DNA-binding protein n=1 Tax=Candidatus Nitrohelix vancouverensis TaxID=2705534 RepID=A0A7T0C4D3_9BACT|nr:MAG: Fis family transcriptional regulator [Candidatus Nitrohelix vancouverensis]